MKCLIFFVSLILIIIFAVDEISACSTKVLKQFKRPIKPEIVKSSIDPTDQQRRQKLQDQYSEKQINSHPDPAEFSRRRIVDTGIEQKLGDDFKITGKVIKRDIDRLPFVEGISGPCKCMPFSKCKQVILLDESCTVPAQGCCTAHDLGFGAVRISNKLPLSLDMARGNAF